MANVPPDIPYTVVELVGKGSFGSVYKGIHNDTKAVVAVKSLDLDQHDEDIADIQKEIGLLSQLKAGDAPNITAFHGSYILGHKLWIIMDFCSGGSMRTLMKAGPIEEKYIAVVVRETLTALSYLHTQGIIHRDIKAANILVNQDGRIQLCDFGVSAQLANKHNKRNTFVGTPQWMAPEALAGGSYDFKIDIWSFGITIYELAKQNPPLYQYHPERVVDMIPRMPPPRLEGGNWSNSLREFVAMCLNEIPDQRPTAEELQKTKFVKATKAPITIMRELIARYEIWEKGGGVRASMLYHPQGWATGDTVTSDGNDAGWDFDTIKSRASGVPKEFDPLVVGGNGTKTIRAPPMPIQRGPRPRNGAEKLYRLFEAPGEEEEDDYQPQPGPQFQGGYPYQGNSYANHSMTSMTSMTSSIGMISIPSFDEDGNMQTPDTTYSRGPEPPPVPSYPRAPSPIGMISMPTEEEMMEMARAKAAAAAAAAVPPPPSTPSAPPAPVTAPTITRTRPHRADSAGSSVLQPVAIDGPLSPQTVTPQNFNRETSPRRQMVTASAPSSPPRFAGQQPQQPQQTAKITPGGLTGNRPHHLASKSVPVFAGREESIPPPVPAIHNTSKLTTPGPPPPHLKSRSQDITAAGRQDGPTRPPRMMGKTGQRPSHLNLGASSGSNFDFGGRLPASPGRPIIHSHKPSFGNLSNFPTAATSMTIPHLPAEMGSLELPTMAPLDPTVLFQPPASGEMMREFDRVLTGLGDALEVVEVGLRRLHKERRQKVPADVEE
ncbi:kinase-like domain-containing protein [Sphaerosporella brunnea]|uniref:non-specific serine/threonine protein kinase n=1 Tax=Sphaerosporella brunnea TaxID=1250544 RepID=A0A5J5EDE4_9PEZI|nr:kinase-like domain-containing protein [Sphaerosporella brunnea]